MTITENFAELLKAADAPKGEVAQTRFVAMIIELVADIEEAKDVPVEVFAAMPAELRAVSAALLLGVMASTLENKIKF